MKEHLNSKPHKEKLEYFKAKNGKMNHDNQDEAPVNQGNPDASGAEGYRRSGSMTNRNNRENPRNWKRQPNRNNGWAGPRDSKDPKHSRPNDHKSFQKRQSTEAYKDSRKKFKS